MKQSHSSALKSCLCLRWENGSAELAGKKSIANGTDVLRSRGWARCSNPDTGRNYSKPKQDHLICPTGERIHPGAAGTFHELHPRVSLEGILIAKGMGQQEKGPRSGSPPECSPRVPGQRCSPCCWGSHWYQRPKRWSHGRCGHAVEQSGSATRLTLSSTVPSVCSPLPASRWSPLQITLPGTEMPKLALLRAAGLWLH